MQTETSPGTGTPGTGPRGPRWPRRHPVLTTLAAVAVAFVTGIVLLAALVGSAAQQITQPDHVARTPAATQPAASAPAAPQPAGPQTFALGESAVITQGGQDAATVTITRVTTSTRPVDQFSEGPQHGYFVTARVRVHVRPGYDQGFDISSFDFYAKSGSAHFDEGNGNAFEGPGADSDLSSSTLNAGETATGTLVFDLPSPHGKIAYSPNFDGGPIGFWRF